ncbi:MAG: FHA domain-containing protein [Anaerolineales bacterium]|jgi:pSer/pThr/pTyr-binding forkhead associated (FHA) protein|nr:FHA domain-containing protein [Anaerolineales bacterium]
MDAQSSKHTTKVILRFLDRNQTIDLAGRGEFILGRSGQDRTAGGGSTTTVGRVDIDLSPYQAYEAGVSRHHVSIFVGENLVTATDLGSTNGTRLNGELLPKFVPEGTKDGDILTLGKLKLQVEIGRTD